jgi:hypothetical protein
MTTYRTKLIEVALPLGATSEESSCRKRKAPRGYPTTFHKWWAQRPVAACGTEQSFKPTSINCDVDEPLAKGGEPS